MTVALGLTAIAGASPRPTVLVRGTSSGAPSYQKSFAVTACRSVGTKGVMLSGNDAYELNLIISAKTLPGTLLIFGGDGEDALYLQGKVTAVTFTGSQATRKVTVKGRFAPNGRVPGVFTVTGGCP